MYWNNSPVVIDLSWMAWPPMMYVSTPIAPITSPDNAPMPDTPVIDFATFRNNPCTPSVNTRSSRFSAVYVLTMRIPPIVSVSRPDTSE